MLFVNLVYGIIKKNLANELLSFVRKLPDSLHEVSRFPESLMKESHSCFSFERELRL